MVTARRVDVDGLWNSTKNLEPDSDWSRTPAATVVAAVYPHAAVHRDMYVRTYVRRAREQYESRSSLLIIPRVSHPSLGARYYLRPLMYRLRAFTYGAGRGARRRVCAVVSERAYGAPQKARNNQACPQTAHFHATSNYPAGHLRPWPRRTKIGIKTTIGIAGPESDLTMELELMAGTRLIVKEKGFDLYTRGEDQDRNLNLYLNRERDGDRTRQRNQNRHREHDRNKKLKEKSSDGE
ncbi:hypothetical protein EVAR_83382_1 [Eumeta japonica]|uniref:Uncharacterized protein n=1 Tax=Eumeta variegata TaxID=151549 RepID=A0A4C1TYJ2_EUMVA|nr:hypothetical protein EVAR_83382_1 [Eumeta japonica]